jgi:hypothetical protein
MVTIEEFRAARDRQSRRRGYQFLVGLVYLPLSHLLTLHFVNLFPILFEPADPSTSFLERPLWLALGIAFVFMITLDFRSRRKLRREPCLSCPHCRRSFFDDASVVIATKNCPRCGKRVLSEPDSMRVAQSGASQLELMTGNDYQEASGQFSNRFVLCWLIGFGILVAWYKLIDLVEPEAVFGEDSRGDGFLRAVFLLPVLVFVVRAGRRYLRFHRDKAKLSCLHCKVGIAIPAGIVIASGHCPACGRRVLRDEKVDGDGPRDGEENQEVPPPTLEETLSLVRAIGEANARAILPILAAAVVGFGWYTLVLQGIFGDDPPIEQLTGIEIGVRGVILLPVIIASIIVIYRALNEIPDFSQFLRCRRCKRCPKSHLRGMAIAIASRHCETCGERIIREA